MVFPLFLFGTLLAGVPILIHLLNRRRFKVVPWAAMEFLLASQRKNQRRIRLEQIILMALRVLALLLLVLAFARPYFQSSALAGKLGISQRYVILIVDNSFSMGHADGGTTAFQRAVNAGQQVIQALAPGDTVSLIAMAANPKMLIRVPSLEHSTARAELMRLELSESGTNVPAALRAAAGMLEEAPPANCEIMLVTDCQRSAWRLNDDAARSELVETVTALAEKATVTIVDVGLDPPYNVAITSLLPRERMIRLGATVDLVARVQNFGDTDALAEVEFLLDGYKKSTQPVTVKAGSAEDVSISPIFRDALTRTLEVRLAPDRLPADDRRYLAVHVIESLRVLLVDGEPGDSLTGNETYFLRNACDPPSEEIEERISFLESAIIREAELSTAPIDEYDVVVLANVGGVSQSIASRLEAYADDGGSVLIFLGDQIDASLYNDILHRDGQGLLPAKLGERVEPDRSRPTVLEPKDFSHPMLGRFKGERAALLSFARTYGYFTLAPDEDATVVCPFKGDAPAIVEKAFGRGKVMMFATTGDTEWSDLPKSGTFLILMQDLVRYLARNHLPESNVTVGETFRRALLPEESGGGVRVRPPGAKKSATVTPTTERGRLTISFDETNRAGVYEIEMTPPAGIERPGRTDFFAVNVDPRESDLHRIGQNELERSLPGFKFTYHKGAVPSAGEETFASPRSELWRHLLYAVLAILCVETFLAQAFGK